MNSNTTTPITSSGVDGEPGTKIYTKEELTTIANTVQFKDCKRFIEHQTPSCYDDIALLMIEYANWQASQPTPPVDGSNIEELAENYASQYTDSLEPDFKPLVDAVIYGYSLRSSQQVSAVALLESEVARLKLLLDISGQPY